MKPYSRYIALLLLALLGLGLRLPYAVSAESPAQATAVATQDAGLAPLKWPVKAPNVQQIEVARNCAAKKVADQRYSGVSLADLRKAFEPVSACDWAVLATAYSSRVGDNDRPPVEGQRAFLKAISLNPASAFIPDVLYKYFGAVQVVETPPFASQPLTRAEIKLYWDGGLAVDIQQIAYTITISQANTKRPVISGTLKTARANENKQGDATPVAADGPISGTVDTKLAQALGSALTDLMPVNNLVSELPCTDNYPDWHVKLIFKDGTILELVTNKSNVFFAGGPWQTSIGKQRYLQYSGAFLDAVLKITSALKMPSASTGAQYCSGIDDIFTDMFGPPQAVTQSTALATKAGK